MLCHILLYLVNTRLNKVVNSSDVTREAKEYPLLGFVTRKLLVKTLQRKSHC
jgi:hypothetical protein